MKINAMDITLQEIGLKIGLYHREQRVVLLGSHFEWIKVKSGVPQG